ncbi:hypothetical protein [Streptosporangium roseum]|uniref:Uncharacterized protein n=1 Tax=Streptosporangium roseum (strain ATCC 12428 / DSM 43021 / JCM 3005 / KCTC 9067 / NCIMB 10171 / NRRL 2505 / NI 9100) TaxID=479432 RepID=D2BC06_STRRD|nr:hypothetical protein [Streptosporangium roseum]ACZ88029.1 hypothetical protein Sros_5260 [Streptosporangium roseum DSM 43021]
MRNSALAWTGHPLTVISVVVLLLNDHLFKPLWPGVVTGKLSDVVGLIVAPPLLNLLIRRPWLAILLTGVAFTLVKTTAEGAALASQAWTLVWGPSRVLADPTDLIALPALYAAWWACNHPDARAVRLARAVIVIPLTVLAVAATGQTDSFRPYSAHAVDVVDGMIVVATRGGWAWGAAGTAFVSGDAGNTWSSSDLAAPSLPRTSACVPGRPDHCYRTVATRLKVEESRNGRWVTAWEISPQDQDRLVRAYAPERSEDAEAVASLAVAVQKLPGGYVVVVANGADGIALRDVSGVWRRLGWTEKGFDASGAVPLTAPWRYDESISTAALLAALAAGLVALGCGVRRPGFAVAALTSWVGAGLFCSGVTSPALFNPIAVLWAMALVPAGAIGVIVSAARGGTPRRVWVIGTATAVIVYYAIMTPFYAWSAGWLGYYGLASGLSVALGIATASAGALAVIKTGRPPEGSSRRPRDR